MNEEYEIFVRYEPDEDQVSAGELVLKQINSVSDMPIEIEIDGVVYYPEF